MQAGQKPITTKAKANNMAKFGIDVSKWQKGFNFDKAKSEGVEFVILRGAYHMSKDTCFESFYTACKQRNIPVGVYHYSMAENVTEAKNEANYLISNVLKNKTFEYPVYMDIEDKALKALGKKKLTDVVIAFCETLEKAGYFVGIYSTAYFLRSYTQESRLSAYDKWIAQWASRCTYSGHFGMWQFGGETNKLRSNVVAGVVCDQNFAYRDYPEVIKKAGLNGFASKTEKETVKKSVDELATEVIQGKWGSGEARKKALTEAGYNFANVQAEVNKRLAQKPITEIAREVIQGKWGVGQDRKDRLKEVGYDPSEVQKVVNGLLK